MIRRGRRFAREPSLVKLSKIEDYLADNLYVFMLSQLKAWGQQESGRAADAVPNWESGGGVFAKGL